MGGSKTKLVWREIRSTVFTGAIVLAVYASVFFGILSTLPRMDEVEKLKLWANFPPRSLQSVGAVREVLIGYGAHYPVRVGALIALLYITMQTFMIPGTTSLNILAGAQYGWLVGFILVAFTSTLGSTSSYLLSWAVGRPLAQAVWPDRMEVFRNEVAARKNKLFNYMLFLRLTPLLPNIFINVASPIVGIPVHIFFLATLLGCAPNNFVAANAGARLGEIKSLSDLSDRRMLLLSGLVAVAALVPTLLTRNQQQTAAKGAAGDSKDKKE
eukprot:CAMPEP_0202903622 /NCGR_PEP_ID=MMETSP1392-20130828/25438_1 /ASSEMBLY_ACC=CAM_ASM_000868 /TAXON_ID=225041 /ORGANISM="Chlamydomonas chlamydogama, Strain SAG 11-48b" /LENGTH=269 /DNA_ID=CAMNT_0049590887 /DNA_START=8 /DNA_END=817 /DNA_ORIENTATION=+